MDTSHDFFPLLQLPQLAIENVLKYLDIRCLKWLRLVCKGLKNSTENPITLKRLTVYLPSREILQQVKSSGAPWNSFRLLLSDQFPSTNDLSEWVTHFGELAKKIRLNLATETLPSDTFSQIINIIVLNCNHLELFEVDELDFTRIPPNAWKTAMNNLKSLHDLRVKRIVFISDQTQSYFGDLVGSIPNLVSLQLPRVQASSNYLSSLPIRRPTTDNDGDHVHHPRSIIDEYESYIVVPVIARIVNDRDTRHGTTLKTICYPDELISYDLFIQLAELCLATGITLYHTEPSIIPSQILRVVDESIRVSECLGSMSGITEDLLFNKFAKLKEITVNMSNFVFVAPGPYPVALFPSLETISLNFSTWPSPSRGSNLRGLSSFMKSLQFGRRPSVKAVYLTGFTNSQATCPHANLIRPYLILVCPNITVLKLCNVQYTSDEYNTIWKSLQKLQKVSLRACPGVNDAAIIGNIFWFPYTIPCMLTLKDLRYLSLDDVGEISWRSYKFVFAKMTLVSFKHNLGANFPIDTSVFRTMSAGSNWQNLEIFTCMGMGFTNVDGKKEFSTRFGLGSSPYGPSVSTVANKGEMHKALRNGCTCF